MVKGVVLVMGKVVKLVKFWFEVVDLVMIFFIWFLVVGIVLVVIFLVNIGVIVRYLLFSVLEEWEVWVGVSLFLIVIFDEIIVFFLMGDVMVWVVLEDCIFVIIFWVVVVFGLIGKNFNFIFVVVFWLRMKMFRVNIIVVVNVNFFL